MALIDAPENSRRVIKNEQGRAIVEVTKQPLYDKRQVAASGAQIIEFFRNQNNSSLLFTNMATSGMLPTPHAFNLYGITIMPQFGLNEADLIKFYNESHFEFKASGKALLQILPGLIPAGGGLQGAVATTENATRIFQMSNGVASPSNYFPLDVKGEPYPLVSQEAFFGTLQTYNTVAFSQAFYVTIFLIGEYFKPI